MCALLLFGGLPGLAVADDSPDLLSDRFHVTLGSFLVESDVTARLDGDTGVGTPIDWDRTFGGGDATRFRLDGYWRFAERHKLRVMWFNQSWERTRTLDEDLEWGGETYPVNARVTANFDFDVYQLAYDYAFLKREDYELTAGIGVHYTNVAAGLRGRFDGGEGDGEFDASREGDVDLPLPVIALGASWRLPHEFWLKASGQLFALDIGDYDGSLQDLLVSVTWQPRDWLGIGVAYNYFKVDVDIDKSSFQGNLDWVYDGVMIFYSASF